jgi:hypothetical protein
VDLDRLDRLGSSRATWIQERAEQVDLECLIGRAGQEERSGRVRDDEERLDKVGVRSQDRDELARLASRWKERKT